MKRNYFAEFVKRGAAFAGFGPVIAGIVFLVLDLTLDGFSLGGGECLVAIVSTYLLAFLQAGASVFNQIEEWPIAKSLLCHFATVYLAYATCYLVNSWIPFEPMVLVIFTAVFAVTYAVIWLTVYLCVRAASRRLNEGLHG